MIESGVSAREHRMMRLAHVASWRNAWRLHAAMERAAGIPRGSLRGRVVTVDKRALRAVVRWARRESVEDVPALSLALSRAVVVYSSD